MTDLPLELARFRLDYTVASPLHLHYYAGSQLRGAFGHALKFTSNSHFDHLTRFPAVRETV